MAIVEVNKLAGAALDWAVAKCEGYEIYIYDRSHPPIVDVIAYDIFKNYDFHSFFLSTTAAAKSWEIVHREKIDVAHQENPDLWWAQCVGGDEIGPTPLIAAMRCYVASKFGDEIEIPDELLIECI